MRTVAILSQKGGAGKTTLALHLAAAASTKQSPALVIDLDPQTSAAGWKDSRADENPVVIAVPHSRLTQALQAAEDGGAALVVIDTAPHAEAPAMAAARAADLILVPTKPGIFDLRAIGATADIVKLSGTPAYVVLNGMPPGGTQVVKDVTDAVAVHGLAVSPVVLYLRADYTHSLTVGQTATEFEPHGKAAEEIAELLHWLNAVMPAK